MLAMPFLPTYLSHCSLGGLTQCPLHPSLPLLLSHCVRLQLHSATLITVLLTILGFPSPSQVVCGPWIHSFLSPMAPS